MALTLFEKLDKIESRYQELTSQISSPEVLGDSARYQKLARTHAERERFQLLAKERPAWLSAALGVEAA